MLCSPGKWLGARRGRIGSSIRDPVGNDSDRHDSGEKFRGTDRCLGEIGAAPRPDTRVLACRRGKAPVLIPGAAPRCDRVEWLGAQHSSDTRAPRVRRACGAVPRYLGIGRPLPPRC